MDQTAIKDAVIISDSDVDNDLKAIPQTTQDYQLLKKLMYTSILWVNAKRVLETGTDVGDSARIFASALRKTGGNLLSVDIRPCDQSFAKDYVHANGAPIIQFAIGDTKTLNVNEQIDLLYLDDHVEGMDIKAHVLYELRTFGKKVRKGGLILVHDWYHTGFGGGIQEAVREFCVEAGLRFMVEPAQYGMCVIEITR